ncbi:hypothetical protein C8R43DRAFT_963426 [Mycena crocata]|nr:hypothetical protein C8R43DRAFT_963426 [Mycena crocata]
MAPHVPKPKRLPKARKARNSLPPVPPPFRFTGERSTFLRARFNVFVLALESGALATFWPGVYEAYWTNYPWPLPINVDPHAAMRILDRSEELTDAEHAEMRVCVQQTQTRIKAWFYHARLMERQRQRSLAQLAAAGGPAPQGPIRRSKAIANLAG